jgi:hypothetical protein
MFMNIQINESIQLLLDLISSHNFKFLIISSVFENKSIVLGPLLFGNGSTWGPLPYIVKCELCPKWFHGLHLFFFLIYKFYLKKN